MIDTTLCRSSNARRLLTAVLAIIVGSLLPISADAQRDPLRRQAHWGASIAAPARGRGAIIRRIDPGAAAEKAGLKVGDELLRIGQTEIRDEIGFRTAYRSVRAGESVRLRVLREGRRFELQATFPALPVEVIPGLQVRYDSVVTDRGHRLRTIITRPERSTGRLPAILLVQWLSCDSIESPFGPTDGWSRTLRGLAEKSGFVLMRVERPGLGDSEGPDCSQCDLQTELAGYRAALDALKKYEFVDANNVFILGASLGGALAPIIAQDHPVRGLIVSGGFAKTWYEHMIEHERRRLELSGRKPAEINQDMRGFSEFYSMYLNERLSPAEAIKRKPELSKLWYDGPAEQYGRPAIFYHQVQQLNVEAAWERVSTPVLILYGEYDWIMSREDQDMIVKIVNKRHPGNARLIVYPRMDHNLDVYESLEKAFKNEGATFDPRVIDLMIEWLKSHSSLR